MSKVFQTRNSLITTLLISLLLTPFVSAAQTASSSEVVDEIKKVEYPIEILPDKDVFGDFVVGPGKFELELSPGESKTVELVITNRLGETKIFELGVEDAAGSNDPSASVVLLGADRGPYTLKDYVSVPAFEFELGHSERVRIPVTITLPPDAEPGGHYGSILTSVVSREASIGSDGMSAPKSAIISRIGTLIFITSPGDKNTEGEFTKFATIGEKKFFAQGPISFGLLFTNTGSIHLNPYGEVRIFNTFGNEVGFVELEPWFALPDSVRSRQVDWQREKLFGKYTAVASINRGYDNIVDTKSFTFWVIDWVLVSLTLGGLFIFFLLLRFITTRFEFKRKTD